MKNVLVLLIGAIVCCACCATTKETLRLAIIPNDVSDPAAIVGIGKHGKMEEFNSQDHEMIIINKEADRMEVCFMPLDPAQPFVRKSWWMDDVLYERLEPYFHPIQRPIPFSLYKRLE